MSYQAPFDKSSAILLSRFFALIIDGIILLIPGAILMLPGIYLSFTLSPKTNEQALYLQLSAAAITFLASFYRPLFFYLKGKTPGMRAMGLTLVRMDNKHPSLLQAFKRELPNLIHVWMSAFVILARVLLLDSNVYGRLLVFTFFSWLTTIFWIANNLFVVLSPNRTSLGDRWAGTIMVDRIRKAKRSAESDSADRYRHKLVTTTR